MTEARQKVNFFNRYSNASVKNTTHWTTVGRTPGVGRTDDEKVENFRNATFGRISPIVLGFVPISMAIGTNPGTIGEIRPKVACRFFHIFSRRYARKNRHASFGRISPKSGVSIFSYFFATLCDQLTFG